MASFICVQELSPTYSTLPRINTLVLLLFVILSPSPSWATSGALAALMTRSAVVAIHAITLLAVLVPSGAYHNQSLNAVLPALDLDIIGTWVTLSAIGVAIPLLLGWAPALRTSKARFLIRIWGVLIVVGAVCAFVGLRRSASYVVMPSSGSLQNAQTTQPNCLNSSRSQLRTSRAIAFNTERIFGGFGKRTLRSNFDMAALASMAFSVWSCFIEGAFGSVGTVATRSNSTNGLLGGNGPRIARSKFQTLILWTGRLVLVLAAIVLPATIALHEKFLLQRPAIPMTEGVVAFEQWSCWAATGLVITATVGDWVRGKATRQTGSLQLFQQEDGKSVEKNEWQGVLAKPTPTFIR